MESTLSLSNIRNEERKYNMALGILNVYHNSGALTVEMESLISPDGGNTLFVVASFPSVNPVRPTTRSKYTWLPKVGGFELTDRTYLDLRKDLL